MRSVREAKAEHHAPRQEGEHELPPVLAEAVAYHLRLAQEASFQAFRQRVGSGDLQPGRYTVLSIIAANPGLTPTDLSRACGRDKSTLTPALKDLTRRGLVERKRHETDERSYTVHLTSAGADLLQKLRRHALAHDRLIDRVVGHDRAMFLEVLRRITRELSSGLPEE